MAEIEILENEATSLLRMRFTAAYYSFVDARARQADNAFNRNIGSIRERAVAEKLAGRETPCTADDITRAYNEVIAEETEKLIASAMLWNYVTRAEAEANIADAMTRIYDIF